MTEPLVAPDVDLTDFGFMPLDVRRLRDSRIAASSSGDEFRAAVLLWCAAWHQKPAASLPDDDVSLAQLAGYGRVTKEWKKVRDGALHGWVKCSDGRLYHPVIAEKANEAWAQKVEHAWARECDRVRKENKRRADAKEELLPIPPKPSRNSAAQVSGIPLDSRQTSSGIPAENPLKGEGEGKEKEREGSEPKGSGAPAPLPDPEKDLFDRGKAVLGKSAGGQIAKLLKAKNHSIPLARAAIEQASTKQNPSEYIGAVIRGAMPDLLSAEGVVKVGL